MLQSGKKKNLTALRPCPANWSAAKFKSNTLICLAKEHSIQENIVFRLWHDYNNWSYEAYGERK